MKFTLLGTRGSRPILTPERIHYGGNTTAFKISLPGMLPIYIDGGTGIFREGIRIVNEEPKPFRATFLITHTHWDHILAFPLFTPLFDEGTQITIMGPRSERYDIKSLFEHQHNKGLIPIPFDRVKDKMIFRELGPDQTFTIEQATVKTVQLNHQGLTLGYRIEHGDKVVCIVCDHAPIENNHLGVLMKAWKSDHFAKHEKTFADRIVDFCQNADLMLHDAHFTKETIKGKENWGHSTPEMAVELALRANVKRVVLGHHAPEDRDEDVERKLESAREMLHLERIERAHDVDVLALREGEEVEL